MTFSMDMIEYEGFVDGWRKYPSPGSFGGLQYTMLAMCGEAGEAANVLKKTIRDNDSKLTAEERQKLIYELGDVLWYVTAAARELNSSLSEVAQDNITKLIMRKQEGKPVG